MFGRKCSLCGGKLDGRNVCKECGLDNTKSDKYYKMNQSRCDDMPLTHVHEEEKAEDGKQKKTDKKKRTTYEKTQQKYTYQPKQREKQKTSGKGRLGVIISILVVLVGFFPALAEIFESVTDTSVVTEEYDPYEYLGNEHPMDGQSVSYTLTSGEYIVGVHISEGDHAGVRKRTDSDDGSDD